MSTKNALKKTGYALAIAASTSLFIAPLTGIALSLVFAYAVCALTLAAGCILFAD